jgi:hypothetical protein
MKSGQTAVALLIETQILQSKHKSQPLNLELSEQNFGYVTHFVNLCLVLISIFLHHRPNNNHFQD